MLSENQMGENPVSDDLLDLLGTDIMKSSSRHSVESIGSDPDQIFEDLKQKAEETEFESQMFETKYFGYRKSEEGHQEPKKEE